MARKRKPKSLSDQLRDIILDGPMTRYELAKRSGVDASQLHRFVNCTGRLTTDSMDKIGEVLNLELAIKAGKASK